MCNGRHVLPLGFFVSGNTLPQASDRGTITQCRFLSLRITFSSTSVRMPLRHLVAGVRDGGHQDDWRCGDGDKETRRGDMPPATRTHSLFTPSPARLVSDASSRVSIVQQYFTSHLNQGALVRRAISPTSLTGSHIVRPRRVEPGATVIFISAVLPIFKSSAIDDRHIHDDQPSSAGRPAS